MLTVCSGQSHETHLPSNFEEIENLTIFSDRDSPNVEMSFEREISIGDSPEKTIGMLGLFTVDYLGRIYISDFQQSTVHLFDPDGVYITSIGRGGSGSGEYTGPPNLL